MPKNKKTEKPKNKSRENLIEEIATNIEWGRKLEGDSKPIPDARLPEIIRLRDQREAACKYLEQATNDQARKERAPLFFRVHKELLRVYGLKPCNATDCTKWLTGTSGTSYIPFVKQKPINFKYV